MDMEKEIDWSEHYLRKGDPTKPTYYVIRRKASLVGLLSNYVVFAGHIRYALDKGFIPVVDMKNYFNQSLVPKELLGKENVWEYFFCQPFGLNLDDIYENGENVLLSSGDPIAPIPYDSIAYYTNQNNVLTRWQTLRKLGFLNIRPDIYKNIMAEFNGLFSASDKILGVLLRGSDYASLKPRNHSVVPPIDYALKKIEFLLKRWHCNKIFLATEDKKIAQIVKKHFGDICIINEQERIEYDGKKLINMMSGSKAHIPSDI